MRTDKITEHGDLTRSLHRGYDPTPSKPVFVFDWFNVPQAEHRPPLLPSGPGWERHHLFPQAAHLAKWFARSPRNLNVHDFTLVMPRSTHQRLHNGANGGPWNQEWTDFARQYPGATQQQVWEHLGKLIQYPSPKPSG